MKAVRIRIESNIAQIKKVITVFLTLVCVFIISNRADAQQKGGPKLESRPELIEAIKILDGIQPFLERDEVPRVIRLRTVVSQAHYTITTYGPVHAQSVEALQMVHMVYKYSEAHFDSMVRPLFQAQLEKLKDLHRVLADRHGFGRGQGAKLIKIMMQQMLTLVTEARKSIVDDQLGKELEATVALIGRAIGIAEQGDRPLAFEKANMAATKIDQVIDELMKYKDASGAYNYGIQMLDLNEHYKQYSQYHATQGTQPLEPTGTGLGEQ